MRKILILSHILLLVSSLLYPAQQDKLSPAIQKTISVKGDQCTITAWIFFTDKGHNLNQKIEEARVSLSARNHIRRLRHNPNDNVANSA